MTPTDLRAARQRLGLSLTGMAEALGISRAHYIALEQGQAPIRHVYALAVEALLQRDAVRG